MLKKKLSTSKIRKIKEFQEFVLAWYQTHKRSTLPWRKKITPYKILVSEIMLQQTQVPRVVPKFVAFMERFPTIQDLANAPLALVLQSWSGLGYNRRAKFLHAAAKTICEQYNGHFPKDEPQLRTLPGIGTYTAAAIMTFAYNKPAIIIETNIRTVFIEWFFSGKKDGIDDNALASLISKAEPNIKIISPREWYWALMDYGSFLKANGSTAHRKSSSFQKQSPFKGSKREIRGAILKAVSNDLKVNLRGLKKQFPDRKDIVPQIVDELIREGLIKKTSTGMQLP